MTSHPWLSPSASVVAKVARMRATAALRQLATAPLHQLGLLWPARPPLLAALPTLLRVDAGRVLHAVGRVDVLPVLLALADGPVDAGRVERALVTLWLGLAGHPGLASTLALPGPFRERVVDPGMPRLLALGDVRGLLATASGPVVIGREGQLPIEKFVVAALPAAHGAVIVGEQFTPQDAEVVARVRDALALVGPALPGGRLERVTVGAGNAANGEARVGLGADPTDLVASAQVAFTRAAAALEPLLGRGGVLVENGLRLSAIDVLARACGNVVALPWRADRGGAAAGVIEDLDNLAILADPTPAGTGLVAAIRALAGTGAAERRRALLVNVDADDFVYSFQFGQSAERRCVERGLCVDRITIDGAAGRDLAGELGPAASVTPPAGSPLRRGSGQALGRGEVPSPEQAARKSDSLRGQPAPVADGAEFLVTSNDDPALAGVLRRLSTRRYQLVVANVRPRLLYDLMEADLLTSPTLVWDRHLHDGLSEERARRGSVTDRVRRLPIRLWSLLGASGSELNRGHASLVDAGLEHVTPRPWPIDLDFFRSASVGHADRVFAGGDSGRDWPLFVEAIRDLPIDVHLVTAQAPAGLPPRVHVDQRLPLWRFRDAMAAAAVTAIPLIPGAGASGLTVLAMAMALGVAVVATASPWIVHYVTDGEEALLVPPGDVGALRDALVRLGEQAELRARLVANARRRVAALCDLEAFTREMFATLG
ncbi:MAG: glycosyltransferase [Candidatus Binatia bacterium]